MIKVLSFISSAFGIYGVILIAITGFILYDRKIFGYAIYLVMLVMIYNTVLKNLFQMPLPATCPSNGFGFPSGHMHFCGAFYIWIMFHIKNIYIRTLSLIIIICFGIAVVKLGYHYYSDVYGAVGFAVVSSFLYSKLTQTVINPLKISLITIIIGITLACITNIQIGYFRPHMYIALYFIIGFSLGWHFIPSHREDLKVKILAIFITLALFISIYKIFDNINIQNNAITQLRWLLISFTIPYSVRISNYVSTKYE